jgi:polyphosphate kinase
MSNRKGGSELVEEPLEKGGAEGIGESIQFVFIAERLLERAYALPFGEGEGGKVYLEPSDPIWRHLEEPL